MIVGKSVHNQRIERLWRDLFYQVVCLFYHLFYHLESCGVLDPDNNIHIFALHYVFIPRINQCLNQFVESWNAHVLSGTGGRTPMQLWIEGQLRMTISQRGSAFEEFTEIFSIIFLIITQAQYYNSLVSSTAVTNIKIASATFKHFIYLSYIV